MWRIKRNNWTVFDNQLDVSMMNFYVRINLYSEDEDIKCKLEVYYNSLKRLELSFPTLEESIGFTENVITNCESVDEIKDKYQELYNDKNNQKVMSKKNRR